MNNFFIQAEISLETNNRFVVSKPQLCFHNKNDMCDSRIMENSIILKPHLSKQGLNVKTITLTTTKAVGKYAGPNQRKFLGYPIVPLLYSCGVHYAI